MGLLSDSKIDSVDIVFVQKTIKVSSVLSRQDRGIAHISLTELQVADETASFDGFLYFFQGF